MLSLNANKHGNGRRMKTAAALILRGDRRARSSRRQPAQAQIVAMVNGDAITALDVAQRTKLVQISTQKTPTRQEVLDELIEDKLKVQLAKRYISEVPKREIESAFANIARRAGMTPDQFAKMVAARRGQRRVAEGAHPCRLRVDADHPRQVPRSLQIGEGEVAVKLQGNPTEAGPDRLRVQPAPDPAAGAARRGRLGDRGAQARGGQSARALPELQRGIAARDGHAGRRGARDDQAPGRPISASSSATCSTTRRSGG